MLEYCYIFFKLPNFEFDNAILSNDTENLAFQSSKYQSFLHSIKAEAERLRMVYFITGSNCAIKLPIQKLDEIGNLQNLISSVFDKHMPFGIGNTPLNAVKAYVCAQKNQSKIFFFTSGEFHKNVEDEECLEMLYKADGYEEYSEPVQPRMAEQMKQSIYDINPVEIKGILSEMAEIIGEFRQNLSAFDTMAATNPEAFNSMLNVIRATSLIVQFLAESGVLPPDNLAEQLAQEDIQQQMMEQAQPAEVSGSAETESPYENNKRQSTPVGTKKTVFINGRAYTRVKTANGWKFLTRGQIAGEGGGSSGYKDQWFKQGSGE